MPNTGIARLAAVVVAALASSAFAQSSQEDYVLTTAAGGFLESRPASAVALTAVTTAGTGATKGTTATVPLVFEFPYYTAKVRTITVSPFLFVLPRAVASIPSSANAGTGFALPLTSGPLDGIISMCWPRVGSDPIFINQLPSTGMVYTWTVGSAPTRHVVVSYENVIITHLSNAYSFTYQIHLYETGRIVFAMSGSQGYAPAGCLLGIDSPVDGRHTAPLAGGAGTGNAGGSELDYVFDPVIKTYIGRAFYDRITSDASGIGAVLQPGAPLARRSVEIRRSSDGYAYASALIGDDGSFTLVGKALPAASTGSFVVAAQNDACAVKTATGALATAWTLNPSLSLASDADVGTWMLGDAQDPSRDLRAAFETAYACNTARDWAVVRTTDAIPTIDVLLDPDSSAPTSYQITPNSTVETLRIASRSAPNPDAFDETVVAKVFGRHILAWIGGGTVKPYDDHFDAVTDEENAFAEGFACYLQAARTGATTIFDPTSAASSTSVELESPTITSPKGPDVAACVAAALFDLIDPANESRDAIDGTQAVDRPFLVADKLSNYPGVPTAALFLQAWAAMGHDAIGATRVFIADGALLDDAFEPNDSKPEATALGTVPQLRTGLTLNLYNDDWCTVELAADAPSLAVDVGFPTASNVELEIRDAQGTVIAAGAYQLARSAVSATTGPVPAGTYQIRARLVAGAAVTYSIQAYVPPTMDDVAVVDWTVGRDYDRALGAKGGIAPYQFSTPSTFMPPGLLFDAADARVFGSPTDAGQYRVIVRLADAGVPANVVVRDRLVTIHEPFEFALAPFVAFPAGKAVDEPLPTHEGTPPFTMSMSSGALPAGLAFDPVSGRIAGDASSAPSSAVSFDGVDVAGSADHVDSRAVVAVALSGKKVPASLVSGQDACGWWFDAVEGSVVSFSVATARGSPRRTLTGALLAPDRSLVRTGRIRGGRGSIAGSKLVCPASGRCYVVASSADAGAAAQLLATLGVALPKSGKGVLKTFVPTDTKTITFGAVAGSTATVTFTGDRAKGMVATVASVVDPHGVSFAFDSFVKTSGYGGKMTLPLFDGGTWTIVLAATSQSGKPGRLTYSYVLRQKKGGTYSAD